MAASAKGQSVDFDFVPIAPSGSPAQFSTFSGGDPSIDTYKWDFGDNSSTTGCDFYDPSNHECDVSHSYSTGVWRAKLTINFGSGGSGSKTRDVGVIADFNASLPIPSFSVSPGPYFPNQVITFTDTSSPSGQVGHWIWSFGDSAVPPQYITNPRVSYPTAGQKTIQMTIENNTGNTSASMTITISSPPTPTFTPTRTPAVSSTPTPSFTATLTSTPTAPAVSTSSITIPVAAHAVGVGGKLFLTDVEIENPNAFAVASTLTLYPVGGGPAMQVELSLAAFETQAIRDVVLSLFGVTNSFGALRLQTTGAPPPTLRMTSRTYDETAGGSFGLAIPGQPDPASAVLSVYVTGIQRDDSYRTNVGAFNVTNSNEAFVIVLRGPEGTTEGISSVVLLGPGGQWQLGVKDLFPSVSGSGLTAEFQSVGGSSVPLAYGILADNNSGDLTYYASLRPSLVWYLPIFARITGVGGSIFKSELNLSNASDIAATVTLTFLERDRNNTTGARDASLPLGPHETRRIDDAMAELFGLSETFGALKVESTQPLVVGERIYTNSPTLPGTVGQQVDPVRQDAFYSQATILGLRQDTAFRSNVGLFNPNAIGATVALSLFRGDGSSLGTASVFLSPLSMTQVSVAALFPTASLPAGEFLTLHLDAGSAGIAAYGIVADNTSQDLTASPALPLSAQTSPAAPALWAFLAGVLSVGLWVLRHLT